jgi:subtilisin family serine protease
VAADVLQSADATVFAELGIAVVSADAAQLGALQAGIMSGRQVLSVSPELIHHVLRESVLEYAQAYRDGVSDLAEHLLHANGHTAALVADATQPAFADTAQATWGMQAVQATSSPRSGKGIRVAVLDTGFDTAHPDFAGRDVTTQSFVAGEPPQDGHGHGTHCIGTSCGPRTPSTGPRYGIAYEADIFAGKVLSNAGSGSDAQILAGINWAVTNRCHVLSMSLGADVMQAHPPYSAAGARALRKGSLIIAAAGNNADRRAGNVGFVGAPANSPEIMAVGALEQSLGMAFFSARSLPARGGQVDIAGPGFQVLSSWPLPTRYRTISGTSMATPHVAGVAALWAEATGRRGLELWATLCMESQRLIQPSVDVGSGLCIAPQ